MTSHRALRLRRPSLWIGLIISLASLIWLCGRIDFPHLLMTLSQAELWAVIGGFAVICLSPFIGAVRWQITLAPKASFRRAFHAENIGYLISAIVPLRAGEAARAYLVSRGQPNLPVVEALSTVVIVRLADVIGVLLALALAVLSLDVPDLVKAAGYSMLALAAVGLVVILIGAYASSMLMRLHRAVFNRLLPPTLAGRVVKWADDFLIGLSALRSVWRLLGIIVTTAVLWVSYLLFYHLILMAFWPSPPLAWSALTLAAVSLSVAVPSSPGYIGVFHAAVVLALSPYLGAEPAVACAIVLHATEMLSVVIFGIYGLTAMGLSFERASAVASKVHRVSTPAR